MLQYTTGKREREGDRKKEKDRERQRKIEKEREKERKREEEREREREREIKRERGQRYRNISGKNACQCFTCRLFCQQKTITLFIIILIQTRC